MDRLQLKPVLGHIPTWFDSVLTWAGVRERPPAIMRDMRDYEHPDNHLPLEECVDFSGRIPLTRPSSPVLDLDPMFDNSEVKPDAPRKTILNTLPVEVRRLVWEKVLEGHAFHLLFESYFSHVSQEPRRRFRGQICTSLYPKSCRVGIRGSRCRWDLPLGTYTKKSTEKKHVLALLLTCRKIYTEAVDLLYCTTSFAIPDPDVLYHFPTLLLPARINCIRSLRFDWANLSRDLYPGPPLGPQPGQSPRTQASEAERQERWVRTWHVIASMQCLRDLQITLHVVGFCWRYLSPENAAVFFAPVKAVTRPQNFTLAVPFRAIDWRSPPDKWQVEDPWEDLPCTIIKY